MLILIDSGQLFLEGMIIFYSNKWRILGQFCKYLIMLSVFALIIFRPYYCFLTYPLSLILLAFTPSTRSCSSEDSFVKAISLASTSRTTAGTFPFKDSTSSKSEPARGSTTSIVLIRPQQYRQVNHLKFFLQTYHCTSLNATAGSYMSYLFSLLVASTSPDAEVVAYLRLNSV